MSTFTGNAQIVGVVVFSGSGTGVVYTVPSGQFAEISFTGISLDSSGDTLSMGAGQLALVGVRQGIENVPSKIVLSENQTISMVQTTGADVTGNAVLFNNP